MGSLHHTPVALPQEKLKLALKLLLVFLDDVILSACNLYLFWPSVKLEMQVADEDDSIRECSLALLWINSAALFSWSDVTVRFQFSKAMSAAAELLEVPLISDRFLS